MRALAAKVSSRGQVVLPKEIRRQLNIKQGDTLLFVVEGSTVRVFPEPESYADYTRGLGKEMWAKLGGGERFLNEERASWD
jgi:AbrB family looped-hinge helix DNA binding protein